MYFRFLADSSLSEAKKGSEVPIQGAEAKVLAENVGKMHVLPGSG